MMKCNFIVIDVDELCTKSEPYSQTVTQIGTANELSQIGNGQGLHRLVRSTIYSRLEWEIVYPRLELETNTIDYPRFKI
jgi:hypothetical protein